VEQAIADAESKGVAGKDLTPFLLRRIEELSGGESLQSNVQLMLNNARLAAEIAVAMSA